MIEEETAVVLLVGWGGHCCFNRLVRKKTTVKRSEGAEGASW